MLCRAFRGRHQGIVTQASRMPSPAPCGGVGKLSASSLTVTLDPLLRTSTFLVICCGMQLLPLTYGWMVTRDVAGACWRSGRPSSATTRGKRSIAHLDAMSR